METENYLRQATQSDEFNHSISSLSGVADGVLEIHLIQQQAIFFLDSLLRPFLPA